MIKINGLYPAADDSIILTALQIDPLPVISQDRVKVPGRPGLLMFGRSHDERTIRASFELNGKNPAQNALLARQLTVWAEHMAPRQLIADEMPDRYYLAQLEQATAPDLAEAFPMIDLTFVCADPYAYAVQASTGAVGAAVTNSGDVPVRPSIAFVAPSDYPSASWLCGGKTLSMAGGDAMITSKQLVPGSAGEPVCGLSRWFMRQWDRF